MFQKWVTDPRLGVIVGGWKFFKPLFLQPSGQLVALVLITKLAQPTENIQKNKLQKKHNWRKLNLNLSYRKEIARQLYTQYVEGVYGNSVTLKSRWGVTENHWEWHHLIDHTTYYSSSYLTLNIIVTLTSGLEVIQTGTIQKLGWFPICL